MVDRTEDYYDLPAEWLLSANFAGRPTSEISDLNLMDGLWAFAISSSLPSSSSSSSSAEDGPTENPPDADGVLQSEPNPSQRPPIEITSPTGDMQITRVRDWSNDPNMMERPKLRGKSATAPPGALSMFDYPSQPPRRAISARLENSSTTKRRKLQREGEGARISNAATVGNDRQAEMSTGRRPPNRALTQPQQFDALSEGIEYATDTQLAASFSQKARVKRTLDGKKLQRLDTTVVDFVSRGLLRSPMSILETPREMYAFPERQSVRQDPSSPQSIDARRAIMLSLRESSSSTLPPKVRGRHKSQPCEKGRQVKDRERHRVYLPGAICLKEDPMMHRRDSFAMVDQVDKVTEPRGGQLSDTMMLDSITMYFDELNIVQYATEQCLDQFWKDLCRAPQGATDSPTSVTSVNEYSSRSPIKPLSGASPRSSRFSFYSASSTSSQPRADTPMRQRDRLRRLLSPAFPGSAFLKSSDWGQHTDNS